MSRRHLLNDIDQQLSEWCEVRKLPAFRQRQIRRWLFEGRAGDFAEMSDLSQALRDELNASFTLWTSAITKHTTSDDGTEKLLLTFAEGGQIECVLLRDKVRRTLCISTQVGCGMGCVFCASGLDGVDRNLSTGEILEQVLLLQRLLDPRERLSHIVVMGMGEPLANLSALLPALEQIARSDGLGISHRRITISTVGLPKAIRKLADLDTRYRLAISLHAPNDALRDEIVPVNAQMPLGEILSAADYYFQRSGRRLTFEYVLLGELNDHPEHAHQLVQLLAGRTALVNVIPYNPVAGLPYRTPSLEGQQTFRKILESGGLAVRFRHRKGDKINAACGQLRRSQAVVDIG